MTKKNHTDKTDGGEKKPPPPVIKGPLQNKFIGGVHKIPIFVRDFPKEIFQKILKKNANFNNRGGGINWTSGLPGALRQLMNNLVNRSTNASTFTGP